MTKVAFSFKTDFYVNTELNLPDKVHDAWLLATHLEEQKNSITPWAFVPSNI